MKAGIASLLRKLTRWCVSTVSRFRAGRLLLDEVVSTVHEQTTKVQYAGNDLMFATPTNMAQYRVDTFASKEPETLDWIDGMPRGSVLWDVGANVGLYSCYAAKARGCRVFAFEPSVFNLELLARNINLNELTEQITLVPLALTDTLTDSTLNMSTRLLGGAASSYGVEYGYDGRPIETEFRVRLPGLSMQQAIASLGLPPPSFIKIDVDGIEHLILKGGAKVLAGVQGVLVEINDEFQLQVQDAARYLSEAGLTLRAKLRSQIFDDTAYATSYNQIWSRQHD